MTAVGSSERRDRRRRPSWPGRLRTMTRAVAIAAATGIVAASLAQGAAADSPRHLRPAHGCPGRQQPPSPSSPSPARRPPRPAPPFGETDADGHGGTEPRRRRQRRRPTPKTTGAARRRAGAKRAAGPQQGTPTAAPTPAAAEATISVPGAIGVEYERLGGAAGPVGPATAGQKCGLPAAAASRASHGGTIVWTEATGARLLSAGIEKAWLKAGGATSHLAYPLGAARCGGVRQ